MVKGARQGRGKFFYRKTHTIMCVWQFGAEAADFGPSRNGLKSVPDIESL